MPNNRCFMSQTHDEVKEKKSYFQCKVFLIKKRIILDTDYLRYIWVFSCFSLISTQCLFIHIRILFMFVFSIVISIANGNILNYQRPYDNCQKKKKK